MSDWFDAARKRQVDAVASGREADVDEQVREGAMACRAIHIGRSDVLSKLNRKKGVTVCRGAPLVLLSLSTFLIYKHKTLVRVLPDRKFIQKLALLPPQLLKLVNGVWF